jgi:hypothetical protein
MSRLFFFSLLILSIQVNATEFARTLTDSVPKRLSKSAYWERSDNQRTGAIVLLSVGGATMFVGAVGYVTQSAEYRFLFTYKNNYNEKKQKSYATTFIVGGIIALTSIPLFIASNRNKKMAKNYYAVSFKMEKNNIFPITGVGNEKFPALRIGLRF